MTLKQLTAFYWICQLGSFSAAANRLNTTQSAISMRIRELESQLGTQLLDRDARVTRPTLKGRELLGYATQILGLVDQIADRVGDPKLLTVNLVLGVTEFVAITWLSNLLHSINAEYPEVRIELDVDLTDNQLRKLQAGEIDIALVPGPVDISGVAQISLGSVDFRWMASPKLDVPNRCLSAKDLSKWPILTTVRTSNLYGIMSRFLGSEVHARSTTVCNSIGVMGSLTLSGLGVGFLPSQHYASKVEAGLLQVLEVEPALPPMEYYAVFEQRYSALLLVRFAELARRASTFDKRDQSTILHPNPQGQDANSQDRAPN